MRQKAVPIPCCSFCQKTQSDVKKLISSPLQDPRHFICNECVAVCVAVLEDDVSPVQQDAPIRGRIASGDQPEAPPPPPDSVLSHPLAAELLDRVEPWIKPDAHDASAELDRLRAAARLMFVNPDA